MVNRTEVCYGSGMQIVLSQGIWKTYFCIEYDLCPKAVVSLTKYPAGFILGLDDKHAIFGDNDMVYLGRPSTNFHHNIIEDVILLRVESEHLGKSGALFS